MHDLLFLLTIGGAYLLAAMSPGPNFLVLTQVAASQSRRNGVCTALGMAAAGVLWATLAATGLGLLIARFAWMHRLLQVVGGGYLAWIGAKMLLRAGRPLSGCDRALRPMAPQRAFLLGLATNLANPKALVFFGSIFATLLTPSTPGWQKAAAVATVGCISISWHTFLALCFSGQRARGAYARAKPWIERGTGSLLCALGLALLT